MQDGKHVILYIDDDEDFLEAMRVVLEANDYVMTQALTAEEGLKVCKQTPPDLMIVDLMMEEVDAGTQFVKELQAMGNTTPIYMLSSVGDSLNAATDYADLGLAGVFQKPISPDMLLSLLKTKLAQAPAS